MSTVQTPDSTSSKWYTELADGTSHTIPLMVVCLLTSHTHSGKKMSQQFQCPFWRIDTDIHTPVSPFGKGRKKEPKLNFSTYIYMINDKNDEVKRLTMFSLRGYLRFIHQSVGWTPELFIALQNQQVNMVCPGHKTQGQPHDLRHPAPLNICTPKPIRSDRLS